MLFGRRMQSAMKQALASNPPGGGSNPRDGSMPVVHVGDGDAKAKSVAPRGGLFGGSFRRMFSPERMQIMGGMMRDLGGGETGERPAAGFIDAGDHHQFPSRLREGLGVGPKRPALFLCPHFAD